MNSSQERKSLGTRFKDERTRRGWTLAQVSERSGLAISTISKAERGQISLTYDRFWRLSQALEMDLAEAFGRPEEKQSQSGAIVERLGGVVRHTTDNYIYDMLCTSRRNKHMTPMVGRVTAHDRADFGEFVKHPGEEFLYMLEGTLEVHFENGETVTLKRHDCIYFDSDQGHIYVSASKDDAMFVVVCWAPESDSVSN